VSTDVRFRINGKVYDTSKVDQVSLRDVMLFNTQAEQMGLPERWADVERITQEMAELGDDANAHPDAIVMFGVTVWACRRLAGEDVTLDEATNVPMSQIEVLEAKKAPKDRQPKKGAKSKSRASAPAASPREAAVSTTPQTSTPQSANA